VEPLVRAAGERVLLVGIVQHDAAGPQRHRVNRAREQQRLPRRRPRGARRLRLRLRLRR
jgi:hypothetical protein